jgi:hypothetical protein
MAKRLEDMEWIPRHHTYTTCAGQGELPRTRTDKEVEEYLKSIGYPHFIPKPLVIIPKKRQRIHSVYARSA